LTRKVKVSSAAEVAQSIKDNSVVLTTGFSLIGVAEEIYQKIEENFLANGSPKDLTFVHSAGQSDTIRGMEHLAHPGLLKRIIGSHWGLSPRLEALITNNEIEAFCLPMGQMISMYKAAASGKPGILSQIGLGTFVDPRIEGGKMNRKAINSQENLVQYFKMGDEDYLFYPSIAFDLYIGRGTTADEAGNITMEDEAGKLEVISAVQAVRASGGRVIFQVKRVVERNTLNPKEVIIPGIFVDEIVVSENPYENHRMTSSAFYHPGYVGRLKEPLIRSSEMLRLQTKKLIGRRAVMELTEGDIVNLGVGIPGDSVGAIIEEEDMAKQISLSVELGTIGGITVGGGDFGITKNAEAIIENSQKFDYYTGCGVDVTFMGAAEIDRDGNVNVSKFGPRSPGCGGFIDITQAAKKLVFCFTFTSGGLQIDVEKGEVRISKEGRHKKFVDHVEQITFNGKYAANRNQQVLFVTERAVFTLSEKGLVLTEVAPGIDLEKDILSQMEFIPTISPDLRIMDPSLYVNGIIHLSDFINRNKNTLESK